jgi:MinD-like ATPase involved in chromosome partitioning or flagellar assembly
MSQSNQLSQPENSSQSGMASQLKQSSRAQAFAFVPDAKKQVDINEENVFIQVFDTALDCRKAMACAAADVQVLIAAGIAGEAGAVTTGGDVAIRGTGTDDKGVVCWDAHRDVSPLNLAAALHKDNPNRDIYLQQVDASGLFISKAGAAGVRGVINDRQAQGLLGFPAKKLLNTGAAAQIERALPEPELLLADSSRNASGPAVNQPLDSPTKSANDKIVKHPLSSFADSVGESSESGMAASIGKASRLRPDDDLAWLDDLLEQEALDTDILPLGTPDARTPDAEFPSLATAPIPPASPVPAPTQTPIPATSQATATLERPELRADKRSGVLTPSPYRQTQQLGEQDGRGRIAAFVSGRGGVGKSTLAVLAAIALHGRGYKTALLDLDLQFGDLSYLAGNESQQRVRRLDGASLLQDKLHLPAFDNEMLLIESPTQPELAEDLIARMPELLRALKQTADMVVVNTSCLWNELLAVLCQNSDLLLFLMDQRSTSIRGCRQAVELCIRLQIPSTRFRYLLNRCSRTAPITDMDATLAMGGAEVSCIADGGAEVDELLSLGCPLELLQNNSQIEASIGRLADLLLADSGLRNRGRKEVGQ